MSVEKMLPRHLVINPNGNRWWARGIGSPPWEGHRVGTKVFEEIAKDVFKRGIPYLSLWTVSEDNLIERSWQEIDSLFKIIAHGLDQASKSAWVEDHQVRIQVFGRWKEVLCQREADMIAWAEQITRHHTRNHLSLFTIYNGEVEMSEVAERFHQMKLKHPWLKATPRLLKSVSYAPNLPPADLIIQTGREKPRWSEAFMALHARDAEWHFSDVLWPEFEEKDLAQALYEYGLSQLAAKET